MHKKITQISISHQLWQYRCLILSEVLSQSKLKIEPPKIDSVLAPLGQVFDQIRHRRPSIKMTIIIDEFDEIPRDLYPGQSPTSDTFLNNIRGLNDKEHVCFVLVGGEKMQQFQGQKFNSFDFSAVDYLDKDQYWDDFQSLVQKPVEDIIEYEIAAIEALYEVTEGNPFFTNRLCRKIYLDVCKSRNRDAYITKKYVKKMIINSLTSTFNKAKMSHFWEDGISVYDSKSKNSIQTLRIRVLRAFADLSRRQKPVTKDSLKSTNILQQYDGNTIDKIIDSFVSRKIFVEENSHYRCKPLLLEKWLVETGGYDMDDPDVATLEILNDQKNEAYVTDKKISQLTEKWGDYGGKEIKVRPWLNQFEDNNQQRLMFKLLENLEFYNEILFRRKLRVINEYVLSSIKEKSSSNILVSCFDPLPKAGPSITRLYKIENGIDGKNVCELRDIPSILMKQNQIKAVVFVDDLIGSGQTMVKNIDKMNEICGEVFENNNALNVFITTVCGLESGIDLARRSLESLHYTVTPYVPDDLTKCFSDSSSIFASESERHEAKKIAGKYGVKLLPDQPLGFNDGQLLLTFPHNCPNNSLPILWSNKNEWLPLFERY